MLIGCTNNCTPTGDQGIKQHSVYLQHIVDTIQQIIYRKNIVDATNWKLRVTKIPIAVYGLTPLVKVLIFGHFDWTLCFEGILMDLCHLCHLLSSPLPPPLPPLSTSCHLSFDTWKWDMEAWCDKSERRQREGNDTSTSDLWNFALWFCIFVSVFLHFVFCRP